MSLFFSYSLVKRTMSRKDDKHGGDNTSVGDDKEMFGTLFREELGAREKGAQRPAPPGTDAKAMEAKKEDPEAAFQDELSETASLSTAERRIIKIKPGLEAENDSVKRFEAEDDQELQELIDTSPIWRYKDDAVEDISPETPVKPKKGSKRLRPAFMALLLLALGAFSISYFGIVDLSRLMPLSQWKPTSVVKHRVVIKPSTPPVYEKKPPAQPSVPDMPLEKPMAVMETPDPASSKAPETTVEKPLPISAQPEPMTSAQESASEKRAPKSAPLKETAREVQPPKWVEGEYPYSIYLGSFRTPQKLQKALTDYGGRGLSPYWVQVDLGKKGIWFRVFAGSFRTRGEVDAFIRQNQIAGALSRHTKYAVLIGTYRSEEDIKMERMELRDMGFSSYEVKGANAVFGLFTGAFYQVARAQKHKADLASKGIQGEVVER